MDKRTEVEIKKDINILLNSIKSRIEGIYIECEINDNTPYVRGAMISALKKDLKRKLFLIYYKNNENLDLTYDITNHLVKRLFGRGISTPYILDNITQKGRKEKSKYKKEGVEIVEIIDKIERVYFKSFRHNLILLNTVFSEALKQVKDERSN